MHKLIIFRKGNAKQNEGETRNSKTKKKFDPRLFETIQSSIAQ